MSSVDVSTNAHRYFGQLSDDPTHMRLPVEIGLVLPSNVSMIAVIRFYAKLTLRNILRKPHLLVIGENGSGADDFSSTIINEYMPERMFDVDASDENVELFMFKLHNLYSSSNNRSPIFHQLLCLWTKLFHSQRARIDWSSLYLSGDLKLTNTSSTTPGPTNDELYSLYETFVSNVHDLVSRFSDRLVATGLPRLAVHNVLKIHRLSVDDIRLECLLLHDMFDVLDKLYANVVTHPSDFVVDSAALFADFTAVKRDAVLRRLYCMRRLVTVHAGFSRVKDLLYLRELYVSPLMQRYDLLSRMLSATNHSSNVKEQMFDLTIHTVLDVRAINTSLVVHDLVVRYMMRKYFRRGSKFVETVDPYSNAPLDIDLDLANFFVFLVKRCFSLDDFQQRFAEVTSVPETDSSYTQILLSSFHFWRHVLAHIAVIAPQSFVAQLLSFVVPLCNVHEITAHDLCDYVSWLGDGDPFYALVSAATIERLRSLSERRVHETLAFLYEQECLLFYILIEHRFYTIPERIAHVTNVVSFAKSSAAGFNWKNVFETLYTNDVFYGTVNHVFRLVREFFRFVIHRHVRDCPNEQVPADVLRQVEKIMSKRASLKSKRKNQDEDVAFLDECDTASATAASVDSVYPTHSLIWEETDSTHTTLYFDVLQRVFNFLNATVLLFNGILGNSNGSDFMRTIGSKNLQHQLRKEQGVWAKDKLLRIYGPIFKDFDLDAFAFASCRAHMSSVPNMVIGNCLSNVQTVNTSFVRVASNQQDQHVIWNLVIRRYEVAAPSLLYLLGLDTVNWGISEAESFPSCVDPAIENYFTLSFFHMDTFVEDVQRVDAFSMMLYTRLITKKRVGESDAGGFFSSGDSNDASALFAKRVADRLLVDQRVNTSQTSDTDFLESDGASSYVPSEAGNQTVGSSYVDFIIDRDEFFQLSSLIEPCFITRYVSFLIETEDVSPLVQLFLLFVQLSLDPRFYELIRRETLSTVLSDVIIAASISREWLKRRSPDERHVTDNKVARFDDPTRGKDDTPFISFVNRALAKIDVSTFVTHAPRVDESTTDDSLPHAHTTERSKWSMHVTGDTVVDSDVERESRVVVNNIVLEREFSDLIRRLLTDEDFYTWSASSSKQFSVHHLHQLDDNTILSIFSSYVYVVRVFADLPSTNNNTSIPSTLSQSLRFGAVSHLANLHSFFPCTFITNRRTIELATGLTNWLELRLRQGARQCTKNDFKELSVSSSSTLPIDELDFDGLLNTMVGQSVDVGPKTVDSSANPSDDQSDASPIPCVHDCLSLSFSVRLAIAYFCLVVYLFCGTDLAVAMYLMRLIISFLYPGVESRECVIVRGSSGSGKSQFFDLLREFFNSQNGILTTQAICNGGNLINTQFMPIGRNFLCQCDEPKRVDNETFKLLISVVPIAARAFQNQMSQSIPILSKLVLTVNNMFQIESDDGILERLHSVFRLSHKYYNLVTDQTDMTRYNSGAAYNVSHQFISKIYPRDIDKSLFQRGLFHMIHHWSPEQTTRPNSSFALVDQFSSLSLSSLVATRLALSYHDLPLEQDALQALLNRNELSRQRECPSVGCMRVVRENLSRVIFRSQKYRDRLLGTICFPHTRSLLDSYIYSLASDDDVLLNAFTRSRNPVRSVFAYYIARSQTNLPILLRDSAAVDAAKRYLASLASVDHVVASFLTDGHLPPIEQISATDLQILASLRAKRSPFFDSFTVEPTRHDNDRKVDLSALPCALDLNLVDLQASLDSFVRFKRAYLVEYSSRPMPRETLRKYLHSYVDEINRSVEDVRYKVKYQEFVDRFETEYAKWRYRRHDNNQYVSSLWSLRLVRVN